MVFGFGKKKNTDSLASPAKQGKEMLLADIPSFLKELESPRLSKVLQGVKNIRSEIELDRKNINNTILEFEEDDLNLDDVDRNLKTVVKRGKDAVVSTVKKEITSKLSNIESYDDVLVFNIEVSQILKRVGDVLGLHTRAMHVFARKYAEKLKEEIAHLAQNRNLLQSLIDEYENFRMNSSSIVEMIRKIDVLEIEIAQKSKRIIEINNEIGETKKNIATLEHDISELASKKEYHEFLEIKRKIDSSSIEKNEIKSKINAQFLKISRPLSKYSYISSFEKPMKKMMEELVADPYQVILSQNKNAIIEILEATTKSVLAGNVSVKDSDKSIQQIEETIDRLDEFLMLKETFNKKMSSLESNLHIFNTESLESKEKNLLKTKSNLTDLESTSKKIEIEIEQNKAQINSLKSQLEISLNQQSHMKIIIKL
jgi:chromosome segregation ATPase